jgi:hypothetical protein
MEEKTPIFQELWQKPPQYLAEAEWTGAIFGKMIS